MPIFQQIWSDINGQGHVVPVHTHVINKHIYKHTYMPCYTCSEENQVCNIDPCCNRNRFQNRF